MTLTTDGKDTIMYAYVDISGAIRYWESMEGLDVGEQELLKAFRFTRHGLEEEFPFLKEVDND